MAQNDKMIWELKRQLEILQSQTSSFKDWLYSTLEIVQETFGKDSIQLEIFSLFKSDYEVSQMFTNFPPPDAPFKQRGVRMLEDFIQELKAVPQPVPDNDKSKPTTNIEDWEPDAATAKIIKGMEEREGSSNRQLEPVKIKEEEITHRPNWFVRTFKYVSVTAWTIIIGVVLALIALFYQIGKDMATKNRDTDLDNLKIGNTELNDSISKLNNRLSLVVDTLKLTRDSLNEEASINRGFSYLLQSKEDSIAALKQQIK